MFTTVAYTDSTAVAQTDTDIPLASDPSVTSLNSHPLFPVPLWAQWAYGVGLTMTRVRISAPRLRPITRPVISPVDTAATPSERFRLTEFWRHPLLFNPVEEIQMLRSNTTAVAERDFVILTVGDNQRNVTQGDMYVMRATTAFTPTVAVWTSGVMTNDDTLQVGRYQIIGARCTNAGGVAARFIFPGAPVQGQLPQIRPGFWVGQGFGDQGIYWQRYGMMGIYGEFESFALPQVEVMAAVAAANPEVIYDIVNVRVGARAQ